jgi:hypothetical protein
VAATAITLAACTSAAPDTPSSPSTRAVSTPAATVTSSPDPAGVAASLSASSASAAGQSAAAKAAAQAVADAAAAQVSASAAAADQAAAESAAALSSAESVAAEQAAEQSAAEESAAAQAPDGTDGWYTPSGNWVSPEAAARAIAAGIAPGETVPNYLRCGTICGEGPTSGEVQTAQLCRDGLLAADECAGIDADAIIAAAAGYAG